MADLEDFEESLAAPAPGTETPGFAEWALVEVMGHKRLAGQVTERVIAGRGFIRISVPAVEGMAKFTKLIGTASIYAITPVSEEVARHLAVNLREAPIEPWHLHEQPRLGVRDADDDYEGADDDWA